MLKISKRRQFVPIFCLNSLHDQTQHILFHKTMKSSIVNKYRSVLRFFKHPGAVHKQQVEWQGPQPIGTNTQGAELEQ